MAGVTSEDDVATLAGQLADLTRVVEDLARQITATRDRAVNQQEATDAQQDRIELAARELADVSSRLQAAADALRTAIWIAAAPPSRKHRRHDLRRSLVERGRTCAQTEIVTIGDECPSPAETIWTGTPAVIRCVAWLCLTSWSRPSRTPVLSRSRMNASVRRWGLSGPPSSSQKIGAFELLGDRDAEFALGMGRRERLEGLPGFLERVGTLDADAERAVRQELAEPLEIRG